jgi:hypothetical protein
VVDAVATLEEVEGDESVEKVVRGAGMQAESRAELLQCLASSVKSSISTALSNVFEAQKPRPTCMMWSICGSLITVLFS